MKKGIILLGVLFILVLSSCDKISKRNIRVEKAKWEALNATKYAFDYNASCFCGGLEHFPARFVVENNEITKVLDISTGLDKMYSNGTLVVDSLPNLAKTIDDLFEVLEEEHFGAASMEVTFDEEDGFPTDIYIDRIRNAMDDEVSYWASNFVKL
jgi:hypothetical protein